MKRILQQYSTAMAPLALLLAIVAYLVHAAAVTTDGHLVYPIDDAYIHMSLARNLAEHGSWSLSGSGFQGASSAPLWTLLLAGMYRLGASQQWTPLALNALFGCGIVLAVYDAGQRRGWPAYWKLCVALAVVICCPLYANVFSGMEHTLQILLTLLLFAFAGEFLAAGRSGSARMPWRLLLLAALSTGIRYEDCFLVFSICVVLAFQRRWLPAAAIGAAGALPIVLYAAYSLSQGSMWAPVSVLVKAWGVSKWYAFLKYTLVGGAVYNLIVSCRYLIPVILTAAALYFYNRPWSAAHSTEKRRGRNLPDSAYLFPIWLLTMILHLDLAGTGWFFRYEAYLIALGLFTMGAILAPSLPTSLRWPALPRIKLVPSIICILALLLVAGLAKRTVNAFLIAPIASRNIQQQQYQVARFLDEYYPAQVVALNDIGAVAFFTDVKIVDLFGLGTIDVARQILRRSYDTQVIDRLCRGQNVEAVVAYTSTTYDCDDLPKNWTPVATWTISDNVASATNTLTFFALHPEQERRLRSSLQAFAAQLPPGVKVEMLADSHPNDPRHSTADRSQ